MSMQSQSDALRRTPLNSGEAAKFWREKRFDDLECLAARFHTHVYERHTHETYVIGSIVAGCELFEVDGVQYAAGAGDLCFLNPELVHDGRPSAEGYAYRMVYPSLGLVADIAQDLTGKPLIGTPTFKTPMVRDTELSAAFVAAHRAMQRQNSALESDEAMVTVLGRILTRHAQLDATDKPGRERRAIRLAKEYLTAKFTENVDLATLATVSGLSRSHLIRAFRAETGLTPHAFLVDRRVRLARKLLSDGGAPADVAAASGFSDQAHMTRAFKARIGTTPACFARMT